MVSLWAAPVTVACIEADTAWEDAGEDEELRVTAPTEEDTELVALVVTDPWVALIAPEVDPTAVPLM